MISAKNMARLNNRNSMTDEERRADIMAETFGPLFGSIFGDIPKPQCPGCREDLAGKLICCNPDAAAAHNKGSGDA
jgi:hypothetical protein